MRRPHAVFKCYLKLGVFRILPLTLEFSGVFVLFVAYYECETSALNQYTPLPLQGVTSL